MAGDVRVTIGANLDISTRGVEEAKRQAAEVKTATDAVNTSARAAGGAVTEAMEDAAAAARDAAEAMRRTQAQPAAPAARPAEQAAPAARPAEQAALAARPAEQAALAYDPRTHAHRASNMLYGVEAHMAGGVTTEAQQAQLEARTKRAGFYVDAAREGGLPDKQIESLTEHLQAVADALDENRTAIEKNSRGGDGIATPEAGGDNAALSTLTDELRRLASGGLGGLGVFGRLLGKAGLVGLGVGAVVGSVGMATRALTNLHGDAREEIGGLADLARQYETSDNPLRWFRQTEGTYTGFTTEELQRLAFGATDATAFMARLDLPGGGEDGQQTAMDDTLSGLEFSRATGIKEDSVAGFLRTLGVGGIERGQGDRALILIREAMREGVKEGVSTSDTFRNLEQMFGGIFRSGVNLTETGIAFQTGMLTSLARTGDRQWQGDQGAAGLERAQTAMLGGGDLAMELALAQHTGEFTAADLGLTGERAETYESIRAVDPVTALQLVIKLAPSRPEVLQRFARALDRVFGGDARLKYLYLSQMGLDADQVFALLGETALTDITDDAAEEAERMSASGAIVDAQAGNRIAYQSPQIGIAERDVGFAGAVESLSRLGDFEVGLRTVRLRAQDLYRRTLRLGGDEGWPGEGGGSLFEREDFGEPGAAGRDFGVTISNFDGDLDERPADRIAASAFGVAYASPAMRAEADFVDGDLMGALARQESAGSGGPEAVNERTGAFGLHQIMPTNLQGAAGWDQEFMGRSPDADAWRVKLALHGLDPDDPIPDHIATQGGDALKAWRAALHPDARVAVDRFLASLSAEKIAEYIGTATRSGADPFTAQAAALATWYGGPSHGYLSGGGIMHPDNEGWTKARGPDEDEPSHQQFVEDILGPLEYRDDGIVAPLNDSGAHAPPRPLEVIVRVEGLDQITIIGGSPENERRAARAFTSFLEAIVTPQSFRGA